jgi:hypothetical protein
LKKSSKKLLLIWTSGIGVQTPPGSEVFLVRPASRRPN